MPRHDVKLCFTFGHTDISFDIQCASSNNPKEPSSISVMQVKRNLLWHQATKE